MKANMSHPLNRGLISWVHFGPQISGGYDLWDICPVMQGDDGGRWANDGTLSSMSTGWKDGPWGLRYLDCNILGNLIGFIHSCPPSFDVSNGDFFYSLICRRDSSAGDGDVFSQKNGTGTGRTWLKSSAGTGGALTWRCQVFFGGSTSGLAYNLNDDEWYHLGFQYRESAGVLNFYVNGNYVVSTGALTIESSDGDFVFGDSKNQSSKCELHVSDFRLIQRTVLDVEIRQHYLAAVQGYPGMIYSNMQPTNLRTAAEEEETTTKIIKLRGRGHAY